MNLQKTGIPMSASVGLTILLLCNFTFASKPTETTLSLARDEGDPDTMKIGMTSRLTLTAKFSAPTNNVKIELLPSVTDTIFAVKQIVSVDKGAEITAGSAWNIDSLHKGPEYTESDSIAYDTRVVYDLGDIAFVAGTSTEETDYQVVIVYDVVMVSMGSYSDGAEFWTSVGMEYDYIWISQISYILDATIPTVSDETTVTAEDVSSITIGEPLTVDVTIGIPYPKASLTVEALVLNETNDVFVTDIRIKTALSAFGFQMNIPGLVKTDNDCPLKSSLFLDVGTVINSESQLEFPDKTNYAITAETTFLARAATDIVGNDYSLGLGVHVVAADNSSDEIWVTSFVLVAATTNLPSFTTFGPLDPDSLIISPGSIGEVQFDLQIPEKTEYTYTVELATAGISGAHPALSLLSARVTYYGINLPCEIVDMSSSYTASVTDGPKDTGTYTFTLSNYGFNTEGNDINKLTLAVVMMIKPHTDVNEDNQHQLTVIINDVGPQTAVITVGGPANGTDSVDYLFELTNSCPTNVFESGSSIMFDVIVTTERNVVAGEMTVQAPFPPAMNVSYLQFCSARIKNVGVNVVCAQEGDVTATLSSWLNDGVEDHATFTFDTICNVQVVDDVQEDKFTIEIILQARDVEEILDGGINVNVGFGVSFSQTQLYVGSYEVQLLPLTVYDSITLVTAVEIKTDDLPTGCTVCTQEEAGSFPSTLVLQWSPNGIDFYDQPFQYQSPTPSGENTKFQLEKPLITKYVRLTDKTCKAGCRPSHSFVTESGDDVVYAYGTAAKSNKVKAHLMFALDKDNTTCFDLPIKSDITTPPALWVVLNILTLTEPYNLTITGKKISCNSRTGLQVSLPMYGKDTALTGVTGNMGICNFLEEEGDDSLKSCSYSCACSGSGCSSMSLFMLYKEETPASPYQLCGIDVLGY